MIERLHLHALLAAIAFGAMVAVPPVVAAQSLASKNLKCAAGNPLAWRETATPGIDRIRNGGFAYTLEAAAIERLVDLAYDDLRQGPVVRLGANTRPKRKSPPAVKTVDAAQEARVRARIGAEIGALARRTVCFDAFRIDPEQATLELIGVVAEIDRREGVKDGVRRIDVDVDGETEYLPVYYDLDTLLADAPGFTDGLLGVFNAGWSSGIARPAPIGFLKLDGTVVNESFYPGLSAILCLTQQDGRTAGARYFYAQKKGKFAFENWHDQPADDDDWARRYREEFDRCDSAVQVGPRIVEFDNSEFLREYADEFDCMKDLAATFPGFETKVGICERSVTRTPRRRTVLASELGNAMSFSGDGKLYLIVTHNEVTLYDLQMLLLTSDLVGDKDNLWAINLAGDSQLVRAFRRGNGRGGKDNPWIKDNPWTTIYSAFTLRRTGANQ